MTRAALALGLVVAVAACGGNAETPAEGGAASAVSFDRAFIDAVVPHHLSAIEMARAAKQAGLTQPDLIEVADNIIATQQAEIDRMLDWRESWYGSRDLGSVDSDALGLSESQMGIMQHAADDLKSADDIDMMFAEMMIEHHQGAITMASVALDRAEHDEVRELAEDIIEAQEREIETLEGHRGMDH